MRKTGFCLWTIDEKTKTTLWNKCNDFLNIPLIGTEFICFCVRQLWTNLLLVLQELNQLYSHQYNHKVMLTKLEINNVGDQNCTGITAYV